MAAISENNTQSVLARLVGDLLGLLSSGEQGAAGKEGESKLSDLRQGFLRSLAQYLIVSGLVVAGQALFRAVGEFCYRSCTIQLTIDSRDEAYRWFLEWLSTHPYTSSASNIAVHSNNSYLCFGFRRDPDQESGVDTPYSRIQYPPEILASSELVGLAFANEKGSTFPPLASSPSDAITSASTSSSSLISPPSPSPAALISSPSSPISSPSLVVGHPEIRSRVQFTPGPGSHWMTYRGRLMRIERERDSREIGSTQSSSIRETINVTMFFTSRRLAEQMIFEAIGQSVRRDAHRTIVYVPDQYGGWRRSGSRMIRPLDSVILRPGQAERLLNDIVSFGQSEQWYAERGIPWRRSFLLYGPPGNGKTSFIAALAGELGLNIYVINMGSKFITDENLSDLMSETPKRCVLLLEDIDAAFIARTDAPLTHSGLLNAIDGVGSIEGRLFFMTTNHIEALSEAFLRPGRVDVQCYFGNATRSQAGRLFHNFFPHASSSQVSQFADTIVPQSGESQRSMASLQAFLMSHRSSPLDALAAAAEPPEPPKTT